MSFLESQPRLSKADSFTLPALSRADSFTVPALERTNSSISEDNENSSLPQQPTFRENRAMTLPACRKPRLTSLFRRDSTGGRKSSLPLCEQNKPSGELPQERRKSKWVLLRQHTATLARLSRDSKRKEATELAMEAYWPPPRDRLDRISIQLLSLHNTPKVRIACHFLHALQS